MAPGSPITAFTCPGDAYRNPKCTPVTLYQSEEKPPAESASSQLAACGGFLAYAIKGGKVRVLARGSATRTLLRGHAQRIVDLAFDGGRNDGSARLASCCAGGRLCTWTVREGPAGDEVAHERGPELDIAGAARVAWSPAGGSVALAVAGEAGAVVLSDALDAASATTLPQGGGARCHDVAWSADGAALAAAAADGRVRVFDASLAPVADFAPAGGAPVHAVAFLAHDRLACAVDGGETLSLWTVTRGAAPRRDHALALARPPAGAPRARARRVAVAGGGAFILVTAAAPAAAADADETGGAALYVAHVNAATNTIDHVAPFAVSQPVLSLAALDADLTDADANDAEADAEPAGFEVQLFCVQTRAIQQYYLRPAALYPGPAARGPSAPPAPAAAPAADPLARFAALHPPPAAAAAAVPAAAALSFGATPAAAAAAPAAPAAPPTAAPAFDAAAFAAEAKAAAVEAAAEATAEGLRAATRLVEGALGRAEVHQSAITKALDADTPRARAAAIRLGAMEAFRECFREELVPAAEAATREALARVDAALAKHLDRAATAERRLEAKIDALAAAVAGLGENGATAGGAAAPAPPPAAAAPAPAAPAGGPVDVRARVRALAKAGDYDGAVYRAVECSDVDVLLCALDAVDIDGVRDARPLPFGQLTLLCLVQQLGTTLQRDEAVAFKLDWLQLAVLGLDASNPRIADHVPAVLGQVKTCMEGLPAPLLARHRERISLLVHVCQSIGSSATRRA